MAHGCGTPLRVSWSGCWRYLDLWTCSGAFRSARMGGWWLAGCITAGDIRLWDAETGEPVGEPVVPVPGAPAWSVAFSPDGKILAASGRHPLITLWDVDSLTAGEPVSRTLLGHAPDHGIPQVVFSPDGSQLASSGYDGTARFWDVATGEQVGDELNPGGDALISGPLSAQMERSWQRRATTPTSVCGTWPRTT